MPENLETPPPEKPPEKSGEKSREKSHGKAPWAAALVVLAILLAAAGYLIVDLRHRVAALEGISERQSAATRAIEQKLHLTNKNLEEGIEALGSKVGMTEQELAEKASALQSQQERAAAKLTAAQQATSKAVASVSSEVSGVKTDLHGARSDLATTRTDLTTTRTDLAATQAKLESAIGDLNVHSGLIAKNHDDLEYLKHRGDRNYFEFTLKKKQRRPISTVSLELKKADPKRSRFTLDVYADDHTLEKKERTLGEPLQFYTGRDRLLYEVVVFDMTNDSISGYLSTPK